MPANVAMGWSVDQRAYGEGGRGRLDKYGNHRAHGDAMVPGRGQMLMVQSQ
jgi:hypothetical protein